MGERLSHKRAKTKAAGAKGRTEVPITGQRRVDAMTSRKAIEVERGGSTRLVKAAQRLKNSGKMQKVLIVPSKNLASARAAMRKVGVSGTVRNISGTKTSRVKKSG